MASTHRALGVCLAVAFACTLALPPVVRAQTTPATDPLSLQQNVFYGQTPADGIDAPVLVFVHGVNANASSWWTAPNDMYARAFTAGYRTAFISLNAHNAPDIDGIVPNMGVLQAALPDVLTHFGVDQVYIVAHSKGGLDVQAAMTAPTFSSHVKAVFTIATPHQGTELADWAFGPGSASASSLGLLSPAVGSLTASAIAQFRQAVELPSTLAGVPYYTISGSTFTIPQNPLLSATGPVLTALSGGQLNDGIVTVPRSKLPNSTYAVDLGSVAFNHFATALGSASFSRINAQIRALEGSREYAKVADHGFAFDGAGNPLPGDEQNSFPWSMQWFKGKLYVGTTRASVCVTTATTDAATGSNLYSADPEFGCTPDPKDLPLRAEIWRYTPETRTWERVYQSPQDVPIEFGPDGRATKFTARDLGFRGMAVFQENAGKSGGSNGKSGSGPANGRERLYVGGVSASSLFDTLPPYVGDGAKRYPPPRLLWTDDGTTWNEVPQKPGTLFGDVGVQTNVVKHRGFRSFAAVRDADGLNHLFVTLTDMKGIGTILESTNPSAGNNAWHQASPDADVLPIFTIYAYRNALYATATLGGTAAPNGYGIFRGVPGIVDPLNPNRLQLNPVVLPTEGLTFPPNASISMQEFKGSLYVGSDRPTELIRINPDDSWDLLIGAPRVTSSGVKRPLSTIGMGFNSLVNGHFYSMAVHNGELFLGTWDWSENVRDTILDGFMKHANGFDLFSTRDGVTWKVVSRNGLGDTSSAIVRNLVSTPYGLFVGAANLHHGLQIYQQAKSLDFTGDGVIDKADVQVLLDASNLKDVTADDPRDLNGDGRITKQDAKALEVQCTNPACAPSARLPVASPAYLKSVPAETTPAKVTLTWPASPGAVRYHVLRADPMTIDQIIPLNTVIQLFNGQPVTFAQINAGAFDAICQSDPAETSLCGLVAALRTSSMMTRPPRWLGSTPALTFTDVTVPPFGEALYSVIAEDANGRLSEATNIVPGQWHGPQP